MIQLLLKGGLGNQMFEYAYALKVSKMHSNEKICLNGSFLKFAPDNRRIALMNCELSGDTEILPEFPHPCTIIRTLLFVFQIVKQIGAAGFIKKCYTLFQMRENNKTIKFPNSASLFNVVPFLSPLGKICKCIKAVNAKQDRDIDYKDNSKKGLYCVRDAYFVPPVIRSTSKNKYIWGFFQHVSILEGIEDELRKRFKIKTEATEANKKMLEDICSCNSVCLHIRRGDYLSPKYINSLCVCDEYYYMEAVRQAQEQIDDPVFFVFSNDHESIEWIKNNYHFPLLNIRYVDLDNPDYEEIRLMMACKHFIISNSTFSWWAAVLSEVHPQKRVWAPKIWVKGTSITLNKDSWISL